MCQCCDADETFSAVEAIESLLPEETSRNGSRLRSTESWEIELDRRTGVRMGLAVQEDPPGLLSVMKVKDREGAHLWNEANPDLAVQSGDVIISVNGVTCIPEIIEECKRFSLLRVELARPQT